MYSIPDALTFFRLAAVPVLWLVALAGLPVTLGLGVAIASATDVLDGYLARRMNRTTERGSRLDSIADHLLSASLIAWLIMLRPEFIREQLGWLLAWGGIGLVSLVAGWVRFQRIGDLHLYSAKTAGVLAYLFGIYLLVTGSYPPLLFYIVIGLCILSALEHLLVVLTADRVDERIGSIFHLHRRA